MYNEYFGLEHTPFRLTPDTRLFYPGGGRGEVLDALIYAITSGEGIIKVVGEVGTGKTMLCRMLEERLPDTVDVVYLANPSLTPEDILHAIALELGLELDPSASRIQIMHSLQQALLDRHAHNRRVVALVEEAQSMPQDTLEEIRLLSNLETKSEKLLQIVLFGQPELDENLAAPEIRQLRERITHGFNLKILSPEETREYMEFRLRAAGYRGREAFSNKAYKVMHKASEGLTRRVNILADKSLLAAFADDTHDVSERHVKVAIQDTQLSVPQGRGASSLLLKAGGFVLAAALGWVAASWYVGGDSIPVSGSAGAGSGQPSAGAMARTAPVPVFGTQVMVSTPAAPPAPDPTPPPAAPLPAVGTANPGIAGDTAEPLGADQEVAAKGEPPAPGIAYVQPVTTVPEVDPVAAIDAPLPAPAQGGNYPLEITSGHPRWSVNSMNSTSRIILQTIRGEPVAHINDGDASVRQIANGQSIRVFNDCASIVVQARVTPAVQPGQIILYNGFEPYQFEDWKDFSHVEPGLLKWLHFAGGYGHLRYRALHWQPVPIDRAVRVDAEAIAPI